MCVLLLLCRDRPCLCDGGEPGVWEEDAQASGRDGQIEDNDQARKVRDGLVPLHSCPDAVSQVLPTPTLPSLPAQC